MLRSSEEEEEGDEEEDEAGKEMSKKATRKQVAAMRKESVALRAMVQQQQAEVSSSAGGGGGGGTVSPVSPDPRSARRREYPVFTPSYGDDAKQQQQLATAAAAAGGGNKLKTYGLQSTKQHQTKSPQIWHQEQQQQQHHDCSAQFYLDHHDQQQQQFMMPQQEHHHHHHITPGNSFRSHEPPLPQSRSRMSSPLPPPLTGLSPNAAKQQQQMQLLLNRSSSPNGKLLLWNRSSSPNGKQQQQRNRSLSPKSAKLEKMYHHCDHHHPPVSPISSMYSGVQHENDAKTTMMMMMMDNNINSSSTTVGTRSPGMSSIAESNQICTTAMVGLARDIGSRGKMIAAGGSSAAALPTTSTWHNCAGSLSSVVPIAARTAASSVAGSILDLPKTPPQPVAKAALEQAAATPQPSGGSSSGYFRFLVWGSKKKALLKKLGGHATTVTTSESGSTILKNNNNMERDKIANLENTTRMLELKLEESNKKRAAAVYKIRALRLAMEILDGNIKHLQTQCQELQQQHRFQESSSSQQQQQQMMMTMMMKKDHLELERDEAMIIGRESTTTTPAPSVFWTTAHTRRQGSSTSPRHPRVTSELFLTTFENAKRSLRKLTDVICHHIRELGGSLTHVITSLLEEQQKPVAGTTRIIKPASRMPRLVKLLYFEAFLNQVMFESFENVNFESNGAASVFDPEALREASFEAFQDLKKRNWPDIEKALSDVNATTTQGVIVNATFHRFFVVRMETVVSQLGKLGETNMPVSVITAFYKAVKAVWLMHHLAFAFDPAAAITIFRIASGADFNPVYMEEVVVPLSSSSSVISDNKQAIHGGAPYVSIMVSPGFHVDKEVCKCKVLCNSQATTPLT